MICLNIGRQMPSAETSAMLRDKDDGIVPFHRKPLINSDCEILLAFANGGTTDVDLTPKTYKIGQLFKRLSQPRVGTKNGSYYLRGGDLIERKRSDANLRSAELIILDGDSRIDPETGEVIPGAPPMDYVCDVLDSLGITYCAHTTYSHDPDTRLWKYRIAIPAKLPTQTALVACLDDLFEVLHKRGVMLNNVNENAKWAQLWFLPRVRDQAALASFKVRSNLANWAYDVGRSVARAAARAGREAEVVRVIAAQLPHKVEQGTSIIETFNKAHGLDWVRSTLEAKGYKFAFHRGDQFYRYIAPRSESGDAGVVVFLGARGDWCCYSHHGDHDPLSGRLVDPFCLYATFEFNGDPKAAARALARPHELMGREATDERQAVATEPHPLPCLRAEDWLLRDLPPPDLLLGHWLSTTTRALLTAATGLGKTMLALDLAVAVASGSDFLHWKGQRPARVLLIDGEMSRRLMKQRIADSVRRSGMAAPKGLFILSREDVEGLAPLNTPEGQKFIDHLIADIGDVDLLVPDNVMSLISGDMKEEQPWTDTLPWIRSLTQRHIGQIWIHHAGLDKTRGYGSSTREWQLDTVLHLDGLIRSDTDVSFDLSFRKARERTPDTRDDFANCRIALVNDAWTWEAIGDQGKGKKPSPIGRIFFEALQDALSIGSLSRNGRPSVTLAQWQAESVRRGLIDVGAKPDSARALFSKYRRELVGAEKVACNGDMVWIVP